MEIYHRRYRIMEGSEEIQMRKIAAFCLDSDREAMMGFLLFYRNFKVMQRKKNIVSFNHEDNRTSISNVV